MNEENSEVKKGVNIKPKNINKAPKTKTPKEPFLSAIAPKIGWVNPQMNCPIARAKLIEIISREMQSTTNLCWIKICIQLMKQL